MFGLAGLYDLWRSPGGDEVTTCTIITCAPNAVLAPIHNRMPVILLPVDEDAWLDSDMTEVERLTSYLQPYPDQLLEAVRRGAGGVEGRVAPSDRMGGRHRCHADELEGSKRSVSADALSALEIEITRATRKPSQSWQMSSTQRLFSGTAAVGAAS